MKQRFALLLLIVNLLGTTVALWSFRVDHRTNEEDSTAELKERITAYLATASAPTDVQARSAEIAELVIRADTLREAWRARTYRVLKYPVILGGVNVFIITIAIGWGMRKGSWA